MTRATRPADSPLDWRELVLALAVIGGAWTALSSEALGALHALTRPALALSWSAFAVVAGGVVWRHRSKLASLRPAQRIGTGWTTVWWLITAATAAILLVVALASPPNTNDALQYHMSRVAHWAAQGSLDHYPTPIERQLWMPPLAEVAALNLYVLAAGDRLVNLVQWMSMVGCLIGVSLIAARLGASRQAQALAALFAATLPMGILQASSAQNDYVTALWLVCLAALAARAHRARLGLGDWMLAGLATGLGVLTKGTFYGLALPFLLWLGVSTIRRAGWRSALRFASIGLALVAVLNAGAWWRNLRAYGLPLGPVGAIAAHGNQVWGWQSTVSNAVRGLTLHLATPYGDVNGPMGDVVATLHRWIDLDLNDPRTTMGEYRVRRSVHEDYAGNPFHALLVPAGLLILAWPAVRRDEPTEPRSELRPFAWTYAIVVLASALAFFGLYKWQPTGSRLQLPLFVSWSPVAGLALARLRALRFPARAAAVAPPAIALFLTAASLRYLFINPSRPLLPRPEDGLSLWNASRAELLFVNTPEDLPGYLPLIEAAGRIGCDSFGLKIDSSDPEYPFWALLAPPGSGVTLEHIEVPPLPGMIAPSNDNCAILCTYCTESELGGLPLRFNHQGTYSLYARPAP